MNKLLKQQIKSFLSFNSPEGAWRRIEALESENIQVVIAMKQLANDFRNEVAEPREIYLSVQEVRSLTVYIRWRKKGVKGQQSYLVINSIEGSHFILRQPQELQRVYLQFNQWALDLNLAHSLRLNGIRRLRQYLRDVH